MKRNITFVSAGAGSGKTYYLTEYLFKKLTDDKDKVRPEAVIATTFTNKAASELIERVRRELVRKEEHTLANSMGQALIGTVNGVCGRLLTRYAFEAGLSPDLDVLDEDGGSILFSQALEQSASLADIKKMNALARRLSFDNWKEETQNIVKLARSNNISPEALKDQAIESYKSLLEYFPTPINQDLNAVLKEALERSISSISGNEDETKATKKYLDILNLALTGLKYDRLPWNAWAKLSKETPAKRSLEASEQVRECALLYDRHPKLHEDIKEWIMRIYDLAARSIAQYQIYKSQRGLMDFIDQEQLVLKILDLPEVAQFISEELDLLLVDEFQDTSPIQLALFLKLAALANKTVWVGDIKQAIYGFRGSDPELMNTVIRGLQSTDSEIKILPESWRSRPQLVELVNELFVPAFSDILTEDQVRLQPAHPEKSPHSALEFWTLEGSNVAKRSDALADGVYDLLNKDYQLVDKETRELRPLKASDIAILSRTHAKASSYAQALTNRGIPVTLNITGLLHTPEVYLGLACLRYMVDPNDSLATAEIIALHEATDAETWLQDRLEFIADDNPPQEWGLKGTIKSSILNALNNERGALQLLSPSEALERALQSGEVERAAKTWGPSMERGMQRLANIEALRGYAIEYEDYCLRQRSAGTASGLLLWLYELEALELDKRGRNEKVDAVNVLTHHGAKGLEWPVVICADLETASRSRLWGASIIEGTSEIDMEQPLEDRTIRYWVYPFGRQSKDIDVLDKITASKAGQEDLKKQVAEGIRLLYVSFTRARDLLILPMAAKSKTNPWLDSLGADWLTSPADDSFTLPGGAEINCQAKIFSQPEKVIKKPPEKSLNWFPKRKEATEKLPAIKSPSGFEPIESAETGMVISIGQRLTLKGKPEMDLVGEAVHGIIAADFTGNSFDRKEMAEGILNRFGLAGILVPDEIHTASDDLKKTINKEFNPVKIYSEWPIQMVMDNGQLVKGWVDLVVETEKGWIIIDHKTFPGQEHELPGKSLKHSGQLSAYRAALEAATDKPVISQWINFVTAGKMQEVVL